MNELNQENEIKTLKKQVENILGNFPEARNSDKYLTITVWRTFYRKFISNPDELCAKLYLNDIMNLPSQDGIKRIRAHIQNTEKRFLPTDIDIAKERGWREEDWKKALGYHVESAGQLSLNI
jgi:hypothetical protein